ncbi:MAG TPA: undecaprenyl/decaprenyl-phosphate alpha-N-acetylglucosaminyl 1-phosphate transferase, partial [Segetibacter sp.]
TCVFATLLISAVTFLFKHVGTGYLIACQIALFFTLVYVLNYKKSKYNLRVVKGEVKIAMPEEQVRLVPLFNKKAAVVDEE